MCRIKLTGFQNNNTIKLEHMFANVLKTKGDQIMTNAQKELINIIRENDKPGEALMTAAVIILDFLKQRESSEAQVVVDSQVLC